MQKLKTFLTKTNLGILIFLLVAANLTFVIPKAFGATLTKSTILEIGGASNASPMIASAGQQLAIDFKTVGSGATSATINFNNFSGGTVNATQSISSTGCTTYFPNATLLPGSITAAGSSNTITISSITALAATTEYCTILTSTTAVTNPSSTGVYSALITAGSDSQNAAFDVLSAGANAYSITGTVAPTFTLALSGTTDTFPGNLSSSALTVSAGITATVNTNAASGWNLYAKDSNGGLTSATASHTIASAGTCGSNFNFGGNTGAENYGIGVSANGTTNYAYTTSNHGSCLSSSAFNQVATSATTANNVTQVFHELANISPTTQPGADYTDTITVIGTGSF
jgi:hypothetical protein